MARDLMNQVERHEDKVAKNASKKRKWEVALASSEGPIPPKIAEQKLARKNELKEKSTLMLAIPDEHILKFHAYKDVKSVWEAIKNRFGGNKESKKMQKTILKQNYENFTNEIVNTAHSISAANSKNQASTTSYADDIMFSFFSNQSNASQFDNKDLEQIDTDDLEDIDFKWQVAMLTMRVKRFIKKTGRKLDLNSKDTVGFDMTKVKCYNFYRRSHFAKECRAPRNQGNRNRDASTRNAPVDTSTTNDLVVQDGIDGYQMRLESLEARIVIHEKIKAVYEEDIAFLKYDVQVKDISIKGLKNQLENALKEKDDLKLKLEKFETSYKNLTKLINSQISAIDKTGLGDDGHVNESEMLNNVVDSCESDGDDNQVNDRFKKGEGYHVVPPPYTRNYMPPRVELSFAGLDDYVFKSKVSETITDSEDEHVFEPKEVNKIVKPSLEKIEFVNARNTTVENENKAEKPRKSINHLIKDYDFYENKMVLNNKGKITGLKEVRPVWDNTARVNHQNKLTHLHPKRNFIPSAVLTKSGQVPVNTTKQSSHRVATLVSTARRANTAASRPNVNNALPTTYSYFKAHSPDQGIFDSKCSIHMTGNKSYLLDYQKINGGFVAFGGNAKGCKITRKGPKSSEDEVSNDARKKSIEVLRKENGVQDPAKEGYKNDQEKDVRDQEEALRKQFEQESERLFGQRKAANTNSTNILNIVSPPINAVSSSFTTVDLERKRAQRNEFESMFRQDKDANGNMIFNPVSGVGSTYVYLDGSIRATGIFSGTYDDEVEGAEADFKNLELTTFVSSIPTTRIHKDNPKEQIIGDLLSALQTRRTTKTSQEHDMKVWRLVDLPKGNYAIGTKWVYRNKKDKRGIVVRNKARLVALDYTQEERIYYDEFFALVARIEAIRLFLAYASFMWFIVYQMDVKSMFLEEVYVCQPHGFEDLHFPNKVYRVEKALYGLHQAPRAWYETLSTYLLENRFRRGIIDNTLYIKKDKGDILLVWVYVYDIIFGSTKKSSCTEFEGLMHKKF
nr:putative ribonuclease H-like domain-containing protein [Tanacetum cinerariifolium]